MKIYDELVARGLIAQVTDEEQIKELVNEGKIDIENINDNNICDVDYSMKNLIIKPNNSDNHSIYVEAEIEIMCFAYEARNINLIEDKINSKVLDEPSLDQRRRP